MQINIPPESEAFLQAKAEAAGFKDVQQYVLSLILPSDAGQVDLARLERLAVEGLESGEATDIDANYWAEKRQALADKLGGENE